MTRFEWKQAVKKHCLPLFTQFFHKIQGGDLFLNIEEKIKDVEERRENNKVALNRLKRMILKACSPGELISGTSYEDYDTIHGSRKEINLFKYAEDKRMLETLIEIDNNILEDLKKNKDIAKSIKDIKSNYDRVVYLKKIGYRNVEIAKELELSEVHVCRLLKRYKEKC